MRVAFDKTRLGFLHMLLLLCLDLFMDSSVVQMANAFHVVQSGVAGRTCRLKPEEGPCRAKISMYYFDPTSGRCHKFLWGGCQGNGNRFDTAKECYSKCLIRDISVQDRPRWCYLNFDYGFCFGAVPRYYYDHLWKVCKERIYSGCGGNQNNFYSLEKCEEVCRFSHSKQPWKSGKGSRGDGKVLIINPKSATTKRGLDQGTRMAPVTTLSDAT